MDNKNLLNIAFEDLFKLTVGLIVDDLKVHRHVYHWSLRGSDSFVLNLKLYRKIFVLAGFKERDISEELEDWYFEQTKRVEEIAADEQALQDLAVEILDGLLKARKELYKGKAPSGSE
ncbi:MAG: hypothetical protein ACO1N0_17120 [Fluviicola sp.]